MKTDKLKASRDMLMGGVDPQVFELAVIGVVLVLLVWFGIIKQPAKG